MAKSYYRMTADTRDFDEWLVKASLVMDKGMGEMIRDEAPKLALALAKATPPFDGRDFFSQAWGRQKKAGVNATVGDISRVYITANELYGRIAAQDEAAAKGFRKSVRKGDVGEVQRLLYAYGLSEYAAGDVGDFDPSHHQQARNRHGRVGKNQRVRQIVRRGSDLNKYRRSKVARVGRLKAGWVSSTRGLGKPPRWPAWLTKIARGEGSMKDQTRRRHDPYLRMTNSVRYASRRNNSDRFVYFALAYRSKRIENAARHMARRKWKKNLR